MFPLQDQKEATAAVQPLKFWLKYKPVMQTREIGGRVIETETGQLKAEEWVEWAKKGVSIPATCSNAIHRIQRGAQRATEADDESAALWRAIKPYYDNWKAGGTEEVINGTPLAIWPGVTHDVVEALKPFKIYAVEDLASATDAVLQRVPDPNVMRYRERARTYLQTKDIAVAVRELDNSKAEIGALKEMVARLQKSQADTDFKRKEAEQALDDVTPPVARKRKAAA